MSLEIEVTVCAVVTLNDDQEAAMRHLLPLARGLSLPELIASESGIWWRDFEDAAVGGTIEVELL